MRRILAAAALGMVLVTGAACEDGDNSGAGSPSASAGTGTSTGDPMPGGSGTASDKQVCDAVQTLTANSSKKFADELLKAAQAGNSGEAETKAVAAIKQLLTDWANGLRAQAAKAANPELRTALSQWAGGLEKAAADLKTFKDLESLAGLDTPELSQAGEKAQQICTT